MRRGFTMLALMAVLPLLLGTVACERKKGPAEKAGEKIDHGLDKVGEKLDDAGDKLKDKTH